MCNNEKECNCICNILTVILALQQNACPDACLDTCDRPMLGGGPNCLICNTRPVMLYTCCSESTPISMPITKDVSATPRDAVVTSSVFRVEKIENNCCTFRVLADNPDNTSLNPYVATNSFFTMNLNCCCICRCLSDTYVECV